MLNTYKPSGRVGLVMALWFPIGLLLAIAAGYLYAKVMGWNPLRPLNFFVTFGMLFLMAIVAVAVVTLGKVRSKIVSALAAILLCLGAFASKYYFQYEAMKAQTVAEILAEEEGVTDEQRAEIAAFVDAELTFALHMDVRSEEGWNIRRRGRNIHIHGLAVALIWGLELVAVLGVMLQTCWSQAASPFSESRNAWAGEEQAILSISIKGERAINQVQKADTLEALLQFPRGTSKLTMNQLVYTVHRVRGAEDEDCYLTVEHAETTRDEEGKEETDSTLLVHYAVISAEEYPMLEESLRAYHEVPPLAPPTQAPPPPPMPATASASPMANGHIVQPPQLAEHVSV